MSILKDLSQSLLKYGEIVVNKTETITQSAKVKIDIKKKESEIAKLKFEIGNHIVKKFNANSKNFPMDDEISSRLNKISELNIEIDVLQSEQCQDEKD